MRRDYREGGGGDAKGEYHLQDSKEIVDAAFQDLMRHNGHDFFVLLHNLHDEEDMVNKFTKEQQQEIIFRALEYITKDVIEHDRNPDQLVFYNLQSILLSERSFDHLEFVDHVYALLPEILIRFGDVGRSLQNTLDQNSQMIQDEVFFDTNSRILQHPKIAYQYKHGAKAAMSARSAHGLLPFLKEKIASLESLSFEQASRYLLFLQEFAEYGYAFDFSYHASREVEKFLEDFSARTKNALLKRKSISILDHAARIGSGWNPDEIREYMLHSPHPMWVNENPYQISDEEILSMWRSPSLRSSLRHDVFLHDKRIREQNAHTENIDVDGIQREAYLVSDVSKEYFGIYNNKYCLISLLKKGKDHPKNTYAFHDALEPGDIHIPSLLGEEKTKDQFLRSEQTRLDYLLFLDVDLLDGIERDYGFPVRELTMREQMWFVASLRGYTVDDEKRVMAFTKRFGLDGARAFLSVEYGDEMRQAVMVLAEKLPESVAKKVFAEYSQIVTAAQKGAEELAGTFFEEGKTEPVDAARLEQELLTRGRDVLLRFSLAAQENTLDERELEQELARASSDVVVFSSIFKTAFKGKDRVEFSSVRGLAFESTNSTGISEEDRRQMEQILRENWKSQPAALESVLHGFTHGIETNETEWYIMRKEGKVKAFVRFEQMPPVRGREARYGGSLNVDPVFRGSGLGEAVLVETVNKQAERSVIQAHADATSEVSMAYVEKFGCNITKLEVEKVGDKALCWFSLERDDRQKDAWQTRKMPKEDLIRDTAPIDKQWYVIKLATSYDLLKKEGIIEDALQSGYVGTRYFAGSGTERYVVFERVPSAL